MRSTTPIIVGDKEVCRGYATINYNVFLQSFLVIFYQKYKDSSFIITSKRTTNNLNEALSESINWVEDNSA